MQKTSFIYVAGNPALYPLEYYDPVSQEYRGAIPRLLADFAAKCGYNLVYCQPGAADRRRELAEDPQVQVISGVASGEHFPGSAGALTLYRTEAAGTAAEYGLVFTETAPEAFVRALTGYAAERGEDAAMGELLAAVEEPLSGTAHALSAGSASGERRSVPMDVLLTVSRWEERQLEAERELDACTGLCNQTGLERMFRETVREEDRGRCAMFCFHFDLWHIEHVGGPGAAEEFLRYAAGALRRSAPGGAVLARGDSGDFFLLCRADSADTARDWARRMLDAVQTAPCAGVPGSCRDASVGIVPLASCGCDCRQGIYYARQCAVNAGCSSQQVKICGAHDCGICEEQRELLADLEQGLRSGDFRLYLQLIVRAKSFEIAGGEALSRWMHPERGLLNPDRYIPLLEQEGRIEPLDFYNLDQACSFLEQLHKKHQGEFFLSANLSRRSFLRAELVQRCREIVERYEFPRHELMIEITESGCVRGEEIERLRKNIQAVRSLGIRVMLDDFGMGYTTFHDLLEFPMDGLKLDKSLVDRLSTEPGKIVLGGIIDTAHKLGLSVLAEGVEEEWQVDELRRMGCDLLQGYLFSIPLPASEAMRRITGRGNRPEESAKIVWKRD